LGLAPLDSWLFDDERLVHLKFHDEDDTFAEAELITDLAVIGQHEGWRDVAWQHAQTIDDFVASVS
jgi:hypothetical protein